MEIILQQIGLWELSLLMIKYGEMFLKSNDWILKNSNKNLNNGLFEIKW